MHHVLVPFPIKRRKKRVFITSQHLAIFTFGRLTISAAESFGITNKWIRLHHQHQRCKRRKLSHFRQVLFVQFVQFVHLYVRCIRILLTHQRLSPNRWRPCTTNSSSNRSSAEEDLFGEHVLSTDKRSNWKRWVDAARTMKLKNN